MIQLEANKSYLWFRKKFNKNIPFFTFVDYKCHTNYVLDYINKHILTIIDCSQDPNPVINLRNELSYIGLNNKVIFLTSNYSDYTSYDNIFYFPYQLFRSQFFYQRLGIDGVRKYKVSCLNRNPNTHKIYTFLRLSQNTNFNQMLISFNNIKPIGQKVLLSEEDYIIKVMPEHIRKELSKINLYRQDLPDDDIWDWKNIINKNSHPAFSDTYLNIITETSCEHICLSEKTFKPLISGQLFTFSSACHSLDAIKKLGFETFEDDIDPLYDSIIDLYERVDAMTSVVDSIYHDIERIYQKNKQKILYNQNRATSIEFADTFLYHLDGMGIFSN